MSRKILKGGKPMRNTSKWLVLLLTLVVLVNTLGIPVMAAPNESPIALYVSHAAGPGSTLQVQVLATRAQTVADGKLVITYDAAKLSCTGTELGAAWPDADQVTLSVNPGEGKIILAFANAEAAREGALFVLNFTAIESGDTVIALDGSSYITGIDADLAQEVTTCPSARFTDLDGLFPEAHDAVDYMVANGYMNGMAQTAFGPHVDLNRAMMVTILYRIAGAPDVSGTHTFVDVPDGQFYTEAVLWASGNGITTGLDATHFAPGKSLTRQELVTFLYRFAGVMGYDRTATTDLSAYTDASVVQPYAVEAFRWAVAEGVIKGTTDTTLEPEATTTRAQVSMMVYRLLCKQD